MFLEVYVMERYEFLTILAEQIRIRRVRSAVVEEIENHIEDQKTAFMAEGMTEREAEEAAVLEMGDPVETGAALDRIHRPKMEWSVLVGVLFISFLGLILQYVVYMTAHPSGLSWAEAFTDGGIGKHLLLMLAGILLMLLICWVDYTIINKYAVTLWILINALLVLCTVKGMPVNGRPQYLVQLSCLVIPFYAGILYHFRGQGGKGMAKSIGCLCIPFAILISHYMLSSTIIIGIVGLILIHAAIYKKWFGEKRKALYIKLWCLLILAAAVFLGILIAASGGRGLAEYQVERIDAWLHPEKYEAYTFFAEEVAETARHAREDSVFLTINMLDAVKNSYLWVFLFGYLGTGKGIALTVLVVCFWAFLFYMVKRQKNQFGYMVSLGCVAFLSIQTVIYIAMNFSAIPFGTAYMPFISGGGSFLLISYFYMGILLSVCNNSRVAEI